MSDRVPDGPAEDRQEAEAPARDSSAAEGAYPGEKARQGHIVLRSRSRRMIFIGGLLGLALLGLLPRFCAAA